MKKAICIFLILFLLIMGNKYADGDITASICLALFLLPEVFERKEKNNVRSEMD